MTITRLIPLLGELLVPEGIIPNLHFNNYSITGSIPLLGGLLVPEGIIPNLHFNDYSITGSIPLLGGLLVPEGIIPNLHFNDYHWVHTSSWWTISPRGYHLLGSQFFSTDMVYKIFHYLIIQFLNNYIIIKTNDHLSKA